LVLAIDEEFGMAITLKQLCQYAKENYGMEIISAKNNMNHVVDWVHMLEDPETAAFLHGHELIFTTGIGQRNTTWFLAFVKELIEHRAAGLVLNIGPYIQDVPDDLKAFCDEHQFPLFTIPWKTRIVDITNDFCHRIMDAEKNEISVAEAFRDIVFFPEKAIAHKPVLEHNAFDTEAEFCLFTMMMKDQVGDRFLTHEKQVRNALTKILLKYSEHFSIFRQDKLLVAVLQSYSHHIVENAITDLEAHMKLIEPNLTLRIGISEAEYGIRSLALLYKRAVAVMKMADRQNVLYVAYDAIGVNKLLIEIDDSTVLKRFYEQTLGLLEDYDSKNQTDYFTILRYYLMYNNSVEKVSKELFVHRNTINYKIKKIKEILQCELDYNDGVNLLLAYKIKDQIG
jgi:hypothetical protein